MRRGPDQCYLDFVASFRVFAIIVALPGQRCLHRGTKPVQRRGKWDAREVASLSDQTGRRGRVERAHSRHRRHI